MTPSSTSPSDGKRGNDGTVYLPKDLELAHKLLPRETNPELYFDDGRCKQCVRLGLQ